jgi:copper resistance protein B
MIRHATLLAAALWAVGASGQHAGHAPQPPRAEPPASNAHLDSFLPQEDEWAPMHAADTVFDPQEMAAARALLRAEEGDVRTGLVLADRIEIADGERYGWDLQGWYGGDIQKLWLKSEGAKASGGSRNVELQALWSRAVTPFFDFQAGVRQDFQPTPKRSHLVLGMQGLMPGLFDVDGALFVSDEGDLTARLEADFDLRMTQRWVLQPRMEIELAAQSIPELRVGTGVGAVEGGLRLRYEMRRELAPYVGVAWERKTGDTAEFARAAGEDPRDVSIVIGMRAWY